MGAEAPDPFAPIDGGRDVGCAMAQHSQGINVDVVVDEDNGLLCLLDEVDDMGIVIEDLPVVDLTLYPTEIITSRLYIFVLYFLPSFAVVKDSLTTEFSVSSSSLKMLLTCRLTFCFVVRNSSAICCCVSHTVSLSTLTSSLMVSSG